VADEHVGRRMGAPTDEQQDCVSRIGGTCESGPRAACLRRAVTILTSQLDGRLQLAVEARRR
jgi:predicted transcriptional regulator